MLRAGSVVVGMSSHVPCSSSPFIASTDNDIIEEQICLLNPLDHQRRLLRSVIACIRFSII